MSEAWVTIIVALVSGLLSGSAISGAVTYLLGKQKAEIEPEKLRADAAKTLTNGYGALVGDLREQIEALQIQVTALAAKALAQGEEIASVRDDLARAQGRIAELERENKRLRESNYNLGVAAEQLRAQVLGKDTAELPELKKVNRLPP